MKMSSNFKFFTGLCLIIFQVSNCWGAERVVSSLVQIQLHDKPPCFGTLVSDYIVVTSVGCAGHDAEALVLNGRQWNSLKTSNIKVLQIITPKEYNETTGYLDVALLYLNNPITNFLVQPQKLCSKTSSDLPPADKQINSYNWIEGNGFSKLRFIGVAYLPVSDKDKCSISFNETLPDTLFCVKNKYPQLPGIGGPVLIDGDFCAIQSSKSNDAFVGFTYLANPKVKEFLDEGLAIFEFANYLTNALLPEDDY